MYLLMDNSKAISKSPLIFNKKTQLYVVLGGLEYRTHFPSAPQL